MPTLGAFFLISAGPKAWLNKNLLSNRILVSIGLISYPLYLWHWPILSFTRILIVSTAATRVAAVLASIALAGATYWLIEKPIRFGLHGTAKVCVLLLFMAIIGYEGRHIYNHNGMISRSSIVDEKSQFAAYFADVPFGRRITLFENHFRHDCNFYDVQRAISGDETKSPRAAIATSCYRPDTTKDKRLFIWGDSHAQMLNYGLTKNLPNDWQVMQVASSGCVPDPGADQSSQNDYCKYSNWFALRTIAETRPDVVIVAQNANHNVETWGRIAQRLHDLGVRKVVFTGPSPHWATDLPKIIVRKLWNGTPHRTYLGIDTSVLANDAALKKAFVPTPGQMFVSLIDVFCDGDGCLTYLGDDRRSGITSWDLGHISSAASDFLAKTRLVAAVTGSDELAGRPHRGGGLQAL
jgi:hypothetical protein